MPYEVVAKSDEPNAWLLPANPGLPEIGPFKLDDGRDIYQLIADGGNRLILLRHVLSSMAIHLFAVLHVPKVVIKALNKLLSSFFWGDSDGKGKKKWISWTHICRPPDEGGLGIRDFSDIQEALH